MRIGIDMRPMQGETRFRGIGKTQEFFMQALASVLEKTDHSLVFYIDADLPQPPAIQLFPAAQIEVVKSPKLGRRRYFRSFLSAFATANPKPKDVDAFLQFDVSLGVPRKVPVVAIFYDLIPLLFREQEKQLPSSLPLRRRLKD